jgi:HEAT repeat protein
MNVTARPATPADAPDVPANEPLVRAAGQWVQQLARTLKVCRLYDARNPTALKFRTELFETLARHLDEHGPITLRFHSDDVQCDEASLYPARSRDDNLALAFYRDGIHALTFAPGIEPRELDVLLDAVLRVTGQDAAEDDLVTLLWQGALTHLEVDYVPSEGDLGAGDDEAVDGGERVPWPTARDDEPAVTATTAEAAVPAGGSRSDDWSTSDLSVELEAAWEELATLAPDEVARFRREHAEERAVPIVTAAVAVSHAWLHAGIVPDDSRELAAFLPRVLQLALGEGRWDEARVCVQLIHTLPSGSTGALVQELLQPISVRLVVQQLDLQGAAQIPAVARLADALGDPGIDWLNLLLGESQQRRVRRLLVEAITDRCRDNPARLAPWLSDPRWYVVRNVVHILGCIGGPAIVGLLAPAARHPEPRVRHEVVAALGQVEPAVARPLLLRMLEGADARLLAAVLHQLSAARHGPVARLALGMLRDPAFEARSPEEKRAIWNALAAAATEDELPELEQELYRTAWFSRAGETARVAMARVIARIGTPLAVAVLRRGVESKRASVRKACEEALMAPGPPRA